MGLLAQNVDIVPTPSHILDGHYPDGNDGSGTIPLTWATVPSFLNKPTGSVFSVDLFSLYLTQPFPGYATAILASGTLPTGWSLSSGGLLTYSGIGTGSGVITVQAYFDPTHQAITNSFGISSVSVGVTDPIPPTIPTGLRLVSKAVISPTVNAATVSIDAPMDPPTAAIPASGNKEVAFYKNGVLDGVVSISPGLSSRLTIAEFAGAAPTRRVSRRSFVDLVSPNNSVTGIPSAAIKPGLGAVMVRFNWFDLENATGTAYTMDNGTTTKSGCVTLYRCLQDIATWNAAHPTNQVGLIVMPLIRSFDPQPNPAPQYLIDAGMSVRYTGTKQSGYQMLRWNTTVYAPRWRALILEMGRLFGTDPNFLGVATQETATGGVTAGGYTATTFADGIIAEHQAIFDASAYIRGYCYINQMPGDGLSTSNPVAHSQRQRVIETLVTKGFWLGGPDILPHNNGLVNQVYPFYTYNAGRLLKFCASQHDTYVESHDHSPQETLQNIANWAVNGSDINIPSLPNGLSGLDAIAWSYVTSTNWDYNDAASIISSTTFPPVQFSPPAGSPIPAGSLLQSNADYQITSYGAGIGATSDSWSPGRVGVSGNFTLIAKINGVTGPDTSVCYGGICIRESTNATDRVFNLHVGQTRIRLEYRPSPSQAYIVLGTVNGVTINSPVWMKIIRSGVAAFDGYYSLDGNAWVLLGSVTTLSMNNSVQAEAYVASGLPTSVTINVQQFNTQNLAPVQYTFNSLPAATYNFSAASRDLATNLSGQGANLSVTVP